MCIARSAKQRIGSSVCSPDFIQYVEFVGAVCAFVFLIFALERR